MASCVYAKGIGKLVDTGINWAAAGSTINAQLTLSTYTPDPDTHDFRDDVSTYQVSGTTDQEVTSKAVAYDAANNYVYLDCVSSITFTAVTGTQVCRGVVLYKTTGAAATDNLLCWCQFSSDVTSNGSDIQVNFDANGVVRFTYTNP